MTPQTIRAVDVKTAAKLASESGKAILFADTCAYLDLIRLAVRDKPRLEHALPQVLKLQKASHGGTIILAAEVTVTEYLRNIDYVCDEGTKFERDVDLAVKRFVDAARHFGDDVTAPDIRALTVIDRLRRLSNALFQATTFVSPTLDIKSRASDRQSRVQRPAQRGKDSNGDCLVAETLLEVTSGAGWKTVFLTSNTKDFADEGRLHADLASDFNTHGVVAAFEWQWAVNELGL
jgi:hypothetical protein